MRHREESAGPAGERGRRRWTRTAEERGEEIEAFEVVDVQHPAGGPFELTVLVTGWAVIDSGGPPEPGPAAASLPAQVIDLEKVSARNSPRWQSPIRRSSVVSVAQSTRSAERTFFSTMSVATRSNER